MADETATALLEHLRSRGYVGEAVETEDRLTISMPRGLFTNTEIETLQQIVIKAVRQNHPTASATGSNRSAPPKPAAPDMRAT